MSSKIIIILGLIFFLILPISFAQDVNLEITLEKDGDATVNGSSTIDIFKFIKPIDGIIEGTTPELTNKDEILWKFELKIEENIESSSLEIRLPPDSGIKDVSTNMSKTIYSEEGVNIVTITGNNAPIDVEIEYIIYKIDPQPKKQQSRLGWQIFFFILVIAAVIIGNYILRNKEKKEEKAEESDEEKKKTANNIDEEKLGTVKLTMNETQIKIIDALLEKDGEASQTKLHYMTNIPKASLSRNLEIMSQKEILVKHYTGTTNYVKIHPQFYIEQHKKEPKNNEDSENKVEE